ncbi:enoyl-CoA hydratase-related protein [Nocardia sp. NBC_00881]|uniref:enoyl-CoA hydratase-related protein n=1 Tax=Nocardia sp. NBC_00881 TaxID=2975995 RepID=UPI00386EB109|nr:enoyl-CoA hydratase-related protein [Nocardia sp. NBC_00881]
MTAAARPVLTTDVTEHVLTITLARPRARNALSPQLLRELDDALDALENDDTVRAGVLTGEGSAFCAGLDLKVFAATDSDRAAASAVIGRVGRLAKPLIGAVHGPAVTGGLELALGCDFLIGSPQALFADTHATVGAFPGGGLTARLARVIGAPAAKAMSLAGLRLDAEAALRLGLLVEVVDREILEARAQELARNIAAADPAYVAEVRALHDGSVHRSATEALAAERAAHQRWHHVRRPAWNV